MNIMLTGPNGYLASHLINYLKKHNHTLYTLGRTIPPMIDQSHHHIFKLGDEVTPDVFNNIDVLIHSAYDFSLITNNDIKHINIGGSIKLLKAACKAGVNKIIFRIV